MWRIYHHMNSDNSVEDGCTYINYLAGKKN